MLTHRFRAKANTVGHLIRAKILRGYGSSWPNMCIGHIHSPVDSIDDCWLADPVPTPSKTDDYLTSQLGCGAGGFGGCVSSGFDDSRKPIDRLPTVLKEEATSADSSSKF